MLSLQYKGVLHYSSIDIPEFSLGFKIPSLTRSPEIASKYGDRPHNWDYSSILNTLKVTDGVKLFQDVVKIIPISTVDRNPQFLLVSILVLS